MKIASSRFRSSSSSLTSLTFRSGKDFSQEIKKLSRSKKLSLSISQRRFQDQRKTQNISKKISQLKPLHKSPINLHSKKTNILPQQQKRKHLKTIIHPADHIKQNLDYPYNNQLRINTEQQPRTRVQDQKIVIGPSSHCNPVYNKKKGLKTRKNGHFRYQDNNYFYQSKEKQIKTSNTGQSTQNTKIINKTTPTQSYLKSPHTFDFHKGQLKLSKMAKTIYSPTPHSNQSSLQSNVIWKHQYNDSPVHRTQPFELWGKSEFGGGKTPEERKLVRIQKFRYKQMEQRIKKQENG